MLYRLVRPMRRKGSRNIYFQQRIPGDVRRLATGRTLALPIGDEFADVRISPGAANIKLSPAPPIPPRENTPCANCGPP